MRIGIDAHVLGKNIGGVERFVQELLRELPSLTPQNEYVVFVTQSTYKKLSQSSIAQVRYVPLMFSNPLIERLVLLPWLVRKYQLEALLVQRLSPWFCGQCKLIVTIHDLTPIKFASQYKGFSNKLVRLLTKNTIRRASLILTPTEAIKAEIKAYCTKVTAPINAFYNGVDVQVFTLAKRSNHQEMAIKQPYLLTVGAIETRKNIETLFAMLPLLQQQQELKLVVVGKVRDQVYFEALQAQIIASGLSERVIWQGFMDEAALIQLYQQAAVFITASRDEGFNIPPLEAMACGTPVVCSNIAVHQELFADAALFFDVQSAADLAEKVQSVLDHTDVSQHLKARGQAKVAEFTWQRTARNVASAISEIS